MPVQLLVSNHDHKKQYVVAFLSISTEDTYLINSRSDFDFSVTWIVEENNNNNNKPIATFSHL
jgi:hypothetical protein